MRSDDLVAVVVVMVAVVLAAATIAHIVTPPSPPPVIRGTASAAGDGGEIVVPMEVSGGRLLVDLKDAHDGTVFRFMVDTGYEVNVLSPACVSRMRGARPGAARKGSVVGLGSRPAGRSVGLPASLAPAILPPSVRDGSSTMIMDLPVLAQQRCDGILGTPFLRAPEFAAAGVIIDIPGGQLVLHPCAARLARHARHVVAETAAKDPTFATLFVLDATIRPVAAASATASLTEGADQSGRFVVDTGSPAIVTDMFWPGPANSSVWQRCASQPVVINMSGAQCRAQQVGCTVFGGRSRSDVLILERPSVDVTPDPRSLLRRWPHSSICGLLGVEALRPFQILLNGSTNRVSLSQCPRRSASN